MNCNLWRRFEPMIESTLAEMVRRYRMNRDYHFIDTKFDAITGEDYGSASSADQIFRSRKVVYSWIQGRALEALAGHCRMGYGDASVLKNILREVSTQMELCRERNGGRLFFAMTPEGEFLTFGTGFSVLPMREKLPDGANFSDLFYAKGLLNAAEILGDAPLLATALDYLERVVLSIADHDFVTDQQSFDPANPVQAVPGKILQGPYMIALSGIASAARISKEAKWLDYGVRFISTILQYHVQIDTLDFWEAIGEDGRPWIEHGQLLCDPGHALEFVGLGVSFLEVLELAGREGDRPFLDRCRRIMPELLRHHFAIGFDEKAKGIVKSYDLLSRRTVNSDMPWWSLPETIRAAEVVRRFTGIYDEVMVEKCADALLKHYVIPSNHAFACQTRNHNGEMVRVIPAVPDIDPGYHTNLSLLLAHGE